MKFWGIYQHEPYFWSVDIFKLKVKWVFWLQLPSPIKINENYCLAAIFLFGDVERNGQSSRHLKFVIWWLKSCVRTSPGALINKLISDPVKWVLVYKNCNCVPWLRRVIHLKWLFIMWNLLGAKTFKFTLWQVIDPRK